MKGAGRSFLTAGVVLVSASATAVGPLAPPLQEIKVASPAVQLTARPLGAHLGVFEPLAGAPIREQVIANAELLDSALAAREPTDVVSDLSELYLLATTMNASSMTAQGPAAPGASVSQSAELRSALVLTSAFSAIRQELAEIGQELYDIVNFDPDEMTGGLFSYLDLALRFVSTILHAPGRIIGAVINPAADDNAIFNLEAGTEAPPQSARDRITRALAPKEQKAITRTSTSAEEGAATTDEAVTDEVDAANDAVSVRDSLKAVPGKTGMSPRGTDRPTPLKDLRNNVRESVTDIRDKVRSFASRLNGDRAKSSEDSASNSSPDRDSDSGEDAT
jgi:hypothetical protein